MGTHLVSWTANGQKSEVRLPLEAYAQVTGTSIRNCIVALHGYGDNPRNFIDLAGEFALNDVLWIALGAPTPVPFAADGGQWYELYGASHGDIEKSEKLIAECLRSVAHATGLPFSKITLLGFSQGAFMTLHTGLRFGENLGSLIALSGYLAQAHRLPPLSDTLKSTPIFVAHGKQDQVVLPHMHYEALDILAYHGFNRVTSKVYPIGHGLCAEEVTDIKKFFEANR